MTCVVRKDVSHAALFAFDAAQVLFEAFLVVHGAGTLWKTAVQSVENAGRLIALFPAQVALVAPKVAAHYVRHRKNKAD